LASFLASLSSEEEKKEEEGEEEGRSQTFSWMTFSVPVPSSSPSLQENLSFFSSLLSSKEEEEWTLEAISPLVKKVNQALYNLTGGLSGAKALKRGGGPHGLLFRHFFLFVRASLSLKRTAILMATQKTTAASALTAAHTPFPAIPLMVERVEDCIAQLSLISSLSSVLEGSETVLAFVTACLATCRAVRVLLVAEHHLTLENWSQAHSLFDYASSMVEREVLTHVQQLQEHETGRSTQSLDPACDSVGDKTHDSVHSLLAMNGILSPQAPLFASHLPLPYTSTALLETARQVSFFANGSLSRIKALFAFSSLHSQLALMPQVKRSVHEKKEREEGGGEVITCLLEDPLLPVNLVLSTPSPLPLSSSLFVDGHEKSLTVEPASKARRTRVQLPPTPHPPVFLDLAGECLAQSFPSFSEQKEKEDKKDKKEETRREEEEEPQEEEEEEQQPQPAPQKQQSFLGWMLGSS
jgi:hypothetical protein